MSKIMMFHPLAARAYTIATAGLLFTQLAWSAEPHVLRGNVPPPVSHLTPQGRMPSDQRVKLALGLSLRDPAGLDDLLQQLYQPANPAFHQWLAPEQLAERFSPTEQD